MADFRPFTALRFDTQVAGEPSSLIAPPYDVVSAAEKAELYARSRFNIARVDYGPELPGDSESDNRYLRAGLEIKDWRQQGALKTDPTPRLFVYDQEFEVAGHRLRRRSVFGKLRLEEWDAGVILPHEHTRARDKQDRLDLLRAIRVNSSPIMALYQASKPALHIGDEDIDAAVMQATMSGERHSLRPLKTLAAEAFSAALATERLYIADGHHRYETALNYRNECRARADTWTGEEPENFLLAALIDMSDPGLVVLPIHRLLELSQRERLAKRIEGLFDVVEVPNLEAGLARLQQMAGRGTAFVTLGLEGSGVHYLTVRDLNAVARAIPAEHPAAWRSLDVAVLHYALLPALGFEQTADNIAFTEDAQEAAAEVSAGHWQIAVLLNPTRVDQIVDVASAGERMPQKSTFFYPKLGTGMVLYALD